MKAPGFWQRFKEEIQAIAQNMYEKIQRPKSKRRSSSAWQSYDKTCLSSPELGHIVFIGTFISIQVDNIMQPVIVIFCFLCLMSKVGRVSMLYSPNRTVRLCWKVWGDLDLFALFSLEFKTHKLCWLLILMVYNNCSFCNPGCQSPWFNMETELLRQNSPLYLCKWSILREIVLA